MDAGCFERGFAATDPYPPKGREGLQMGYPRLQGLLDTLRSVSLCLGRKEIRVLHPFKGITEVIKGRSWNAGRVERLEAALETPYPWCV